MNRPLLFVAAVLGLLWGTVALAPEPPYTPHQPSAEYIEAAAVYREKNLSPMPESWRWDYFTAEDGRKMRWGVATPEGPVKATVIFVPGYAGALEMYAAYHQEMLVRGYRVFGFDMRGQGGSARMLKNPEKPWVPDFGLYSSDLAGFVREVRASVDGPLLLVGESFGGHVSMRAVGDHELPLDGALFSVPAMKIQTAHFDYNSVRAMVEVARLTGFGKKYAPMQKNWEPFRTDLSEGNYCGNNLERIHIKDTLYAVRPEIRVGGTTNQWVAEIMESSDRISSPAYLAGITMPVAIVNGDSDDIVQRDVSVNACLNDLPNCVLTTLENSGHCTIAEPKGVRDGLMDALDDLLVRVKVERS